MGYQRDDRYGGDRWRDRDQGREGGGWDRDRDNREESRAGRGWNEGRREEMGWGPGLGGGRDRDRDRGGDDRGFFERAGEEVRSWFSGDDDNRDRGDRSRMSRRDNGFEGRGSDYGRGGSYGNMSGGWGNQSGESWNRDRPGERGWFGGSGDDNDDRGERYGAGAGAGGFGGGRSHHWEGGGAGGFGGPSDRGRRFDRVDAGSTGSHGAHPMSSPVGHGFDSSGNSARYAAIMREQGGGRGGDIHDPHYSQWRRRQIDELDRDYDEYRREHQSKFEQEFGTWRSKRQSQRQMLNKVEEQMEVAGSDGTKVGTVDKVRGDRIILTKGDEEAGGMHHSIPCSWVEGVEDGKVTLNRSAEDARSEWRNEDRSRALFEREDQGSEGPHMLNRSFSGTYSDGDRDGDRDR